MEKGEGMEVPSPFAIMGISAPGPSYFASQRYFSRAGKVPKRAQRGRGFRFPLPLRTPSPKTASSRGLTAPSPERLPPCCRRAMQNNELLAFIRSEAQSFLYSNRSLTLQSSTQHILANTSKSMRSTSPLHQLLMTSNRLPICLASWFRLMPRSCMISSRCS